GGAGARGGLARRRARAPAAPATAGRGRARGGDAPPCTAGRGGTLVGYEPGLERRRLVQFDRRGNLVAACRWSATGALAWARCRTLDGAWIGLEPGGAPQAAWGASDRLWRLDPAEPWAPAEAITAFQALDYPLPDLVPPPRPPAP